MKVKLITASLSIDLRGVEHSSQEPCQFGPTQWCSPVLTSQDIDAMWISFTSYMSQ